MTLPRVTALHVYPVKSCRGISLASATLTASGIANDRRWMIVDETGRFISQREIAELALIVPELTSTGLVLRHREDSIVVPFMPDGAPRPRSMVSVWSATFEAVGYEASVGVDAWLSAILSKNVRFIEDAHTRPLKPARVVAGYHEAMSFADGYPFLIISEESLADLNARIAARKPSFVPLPMNRFRPNIVIAGTAPYAEDAHERMQIGGASFLGGEPCGRCVITTIDQDTLVSAKEPLATLATYRRQDGEVMFGQNLRIATSSKMVLHVGDTVTFDRIT